MRSILPTLTINKASGILFLKDFIVCEGNWTYLAGTIDYSTYTNKVTFSNTQTISGTHNLGEVEFNSNAGNITFTIASGTNLVVNGALTFSGSNYGRISTGTIEAKGNINCNNTYWTNMGHTGTLIINGTSDQYWNGSSSAGLSRIPLVQINKTSGTLTFSNTLNFEKNFTFIDGAVDTETNNSNFYFYNTTTIDGQGSTITMPFNNVFIAGVQNLGGNFDVNGNLTINTGSSLDVSNTSNYQLNLAGNWTNMANATATSFNQRTGKVVFDGINNQTVTAGGNEVFYNFEISKSANKLILNDNVTVINSLNFVSGLISTNLSALLILNDNITLSNVSDISFVNGPCRKIGNDIFSFPVGKIIGSSAYYRPISITAPSNISDHFTAEYFANDPNSSYDVTLKDITLDDISRCEYWILNRTNGSSNVKVTLSWNSITSCGADNTTSPKVAKWDGSKWKDFGNGGTTGNTNNGTLISSTSITSFSPFTFSYINSGTVLPIELIEFNVSCNKNLDLIDISWVTASEINNDFFTIQCSDDGENWRDINEIPGAGNSTHLINYEYRSRKLNEKYFRLKQTDFDGKSNYSDIVSVDCASNHIDELIFFPNPSHGLNQIFVANNVGIIEISDMSGKVIFNHDLGNDKSNYIDVSHFVKGIYSIKYTHDGDVQIKRLLIN